jgi:hypothetical protein
MATYFYGFGPRQLWTLQSLICRRPWSMCTKCGATKFETVVVRTISMPRVAKPDSATVLSGVLSPGSVSNLV